MTMIFGTLENPNNIFAWANDDISKHFFLLFFQNFDFLGS